MSSETADRSIEKACLSNPLPVDSGQLVAQMRCIAAHALRGMYLPREGMFVFRKKKGPEGTTYEGRSHRYTAIVLIALAGENRDAVYDILDGQTPANVCQRLEQRVLDTCDVGDLALTLWAFCSLKIKDRRQICEMLRGLLQSGRGCKTVEAAWALKAFCVDCDAKVGDGRERLAQRLMSAFNSEAGIFPHFIGNGRSLRDHVSCFADQVYPIQALSAYHRWSADEKALEVACRCAEKICELQGAGGQWWWHYDRRTGKVLEGYPVYSVHQDAMAPMALFELQRSGGPDHSTAIVKGLSWMLNAPEINRSLIDSTHCAIWRKVDRRGLRKLCRYVKAAASRIHPSFQVSWIDRLFQPVTVDYECRPYHLAWLLYAWPETRIQQLKGGDS